MRARVTLLAVALAWCLAAGAAETSVPFWIMVEFLSGQVAVTSIHPSETTCAAAARDAREVNTQAGTYLQVSCHRIHVRWWGSPTTGPIEIAPALPP